MARWQGRWEFRNVMHYLHGSTGKETVEAESEEGARQVIKHKAARQLFGSTMMQTYITVSDLRKV